MNQPDVILHCDWSLNPKKRFYAAAENTAQGWLIRAPQPVPNHPLDLLTAYEDKQLFIGLDLPLGVPAAWAEQAGLSSFRQLLKELLKKDARWEHFFSVAEQHSQISVYRPFYPKRPGGTKLQHLIDGLNLQSANQLRRMCDLPTKSRRAAAPLFWTMGAQQVGKAAISAWQELLIPLLGHVPDQIGLWPFDGLLNPLLSAKQIVIAEVYPAEIYGHIKVELKTADGRPASKRSQEARQRCHQAILNICAQLDLGLADTAATELKNGFGAAADGEDRFDAFVGVLGMLMVICGQLQEGQPPQDNLRPIEGWLLGMSEKSSL